MTSYLTVRVQSEDGVIFTVDYEVAIISKTIDAMLNNNLVPWGQDINLVISLKILSFVLNKVLQWMVRYKDLIKENNYIFNDIVEERFKNFDEWDKKFFKMNRCTLGQLGSAASYLEIRGLKQHVRHKIIKLVNGETSEEDSSTEAGKRKANHSLDSSGTRKRQRPE